MAFENIINGAGRMAQQLKSLAKADDLLVFNPRGSIWCTEKLTPRGYPLTSACAP